MKITAELNCIFAAVLAVLCAALFRWLLEPWLGGHFAYGTFLIAVAVVSRLAGFRCAVLTALLSIIAADWWFIEPRHSLVLYDHQEWPFVVLFLALSLAIAQLSRILQNERNMVEAARQSLDNERRTLQAIIDGATNEHLVYLDREFNFVRVNETYARTCGYHAPEMIGKNHFALYPHEENEAIFRRVRDTGEPVEYRDKPFSFPDQPERGITYWDWTLTPVKASDGTVEGLVFALRETTDRKRAEDETRENAGRLSSVVKSLREGLIIAKPDETLFDWNDAALEMYGFANIQEARRSLAEFAQIFELRTLDNEVLPLDRWPLRRVLGGEEIRDLELRISRRGTAWSRIFSYVGTLLRAECGDPKLAIITVTDVTDRKAGQEAIAVREQRFRRLIEVSSEMVWVADADGRTVEDSPSWRSFTGCSLEGYLGDNWLKAVHPDDRARLKHTWRRATETRGVYHSEFRMRHRSGEYRHVMCRAVPILTDDGRVREWIGMNTDVTEQRRREQQIEKLTRLYAVLSKANEAIVRIRDASALFQAVCEIVAELGGFPLVWIGKVEGVKVVPSAVCGAGAAYADEIRVETSGEWGRGATGTCIREDRPVINEDFATNEQSAPWKETALRYGFRSSAAFPLHQAGQAIGSLTLYSKAPQAFDAEQVALLEALSSDLSFALDALNDEQGRTVAEQALKLSEQRYRSLFSSINEGFSLHETIYDQAGKPCDYRFIEVNPAFERETGLKSADIMGRTLFEVLPQTEAVWLERYSRVVLTGEPDHFEAYLEGTGRWYEVYASRTAVNQLCVVLLNITDRKEAEQALAESEARLAITFDRAGVGIVEVIEGDRFIAVNDRACEILGYSRAELLTMDVHNLTFAEDRELSDRMNSAIHQGPHDRVIYEKRYARKNGDPIWCHVTISAIRNEAGRWTGSITTIEDISEQKRAEGALQLALDDLRQADRRKDEFLAMLAHELRNPMAAISTATSLLSIPGVDEKKAEFARSTLKERVHQLSRLLDDLLDVSRVTTGKVHLQKEQLDLSTVIEAAVQTVKVMFDQREQQLEVRIYDQLPIFGDPVRLEQVVSNLLVNAAKYTDWGGATAVTAMRQGAYALIRFKDNGSGIAPEVLPKIFDLFQQADTSLHRTSGGLGIGLTIAKRIVELHDGVISAHSEGIGQGSEFEIRLPLRERDDSDTVATPSLGERENVEPGLRILLIEDQKDAALITAAALELEGHSTAIEFDGRRGVETALKLRPDIVLLDIGLPELSGYEVAKALRRSGLSETLVIAISGYGQPQDLERSRESGIDYHLLKPLDQRKLRAILSEHQRKRMAKHSAALH